MELVTFPITTLQQTQIMRMIPFHWLARIATLRLPGSHQHLTMMDSISLFTVVNIEVNGMTVLNAMWMLMILRPLLALEVDVTMLQRKMMSTVKMGTVNHVMDSLTHLLA